MRLKRRFEYTQFIPSPDGKHVAFTTNERGQLRVGTLELESGKHTWHATLGNRLARLENDLHPRLAWHPKGRTLAFATELRGAPHLGLVSMKTGEVQLRELFKIGRVLDMSYSQWGIPAHVGPGGRTVRPLSV